MVSNLPETLKVLPLLIVKLGDTIPDLAACRGGFETWIAAALGSAPVRIVDPRHDPQGLPGPAEISAAVITGSRSMVTDRAAWSEHTARWLAGVVAAGKPVLGICYGHQLLAHALGGEADWHPEGIEIGTVVVRKTPAAIADPLFAELPEVFHAQAVHRQTAVRLPPGAECLAHNDFEPHHAFRFGQAAWGVQFHPEFDAFAMRGYIRHLADALRNDGADPDAIARTVTDTPAAAAILARFGRFVMERSARPMA